MLHERQYSLILENRKKQSVPVPIAHGPFPVLKGPEPLKDKENDPGPRWGILETGPGEESRIPTSRDDRESEESEGSEECDAQSTHIKHILTD